VTKLFYCDTTPWSGTVTAQERSLAISARPRPSHAIPGVAEQSETKSHISYYVTANSQIIHMGTLEHHPSLRHSHTHKYTFAQLD